jgi:hypothetical protein
MLTSKEFLYDHRNSIGASLCLCLAPKTDENLSKSSQLLQVAEGYDWHAKSGEVMATSLILATVTNKTEIADRLRGATTQLVNGVLSDPVRFFEDGLDAMYGLLGLSLVGDPSLDNLVSPLLSFPALNNAVKNRAPLDATAIYLFLMGRIAFKDAQDKQTKEKARAEIADVYGKIVDRAETLPYTSMGPAFAEQFVDALSLVKEGLSDLALSKYKDFVKSADGGNMVVSVDSVNPMVPRVDLLSKILLALGEAGYYHPYRLSSKESQLFQEVLQKEQGFKHVRKAELIALLVTPALALAGFLVSTRGLGPELLLIVPYAIVARSLYRYGKLSSRDLKAVGEWFLNQVR